MRIKAKIIWRGWWAKYWSFAKCPCCFGFELFMGPVLITIHDFRT